MSLHLFPRTVFLAPVVAWLALSATACAQTFTSDEGFETQAGMATVDPTIRTAQLIESRRWDQAIETMLAVIDAGSRELVESGQSAERLSGFRTLLPAPRHMAVFANRQFAMHPELLDRWRRRVDSRVTSLWQLAGRSGSANSLRNIVETYFFSSVGDQAILDLGLIYAERGQVDLAIRTLCRIDRRFARFHRGSGSEASWDPPFYPDSDLPIAEVAARIILLRAIARRGEPDSDLQWFREQFGEVTGQLGEQRGVLGDLLAQRVKEFAERPVADSADRLKSGTRPPQQAWEIRFPGQTSRSGLPATVPLIVDDRVLWRDSDRIYVARLANGQPALDNGSSDPAAGLESYAIWRSATAADREGGRATGSVSGRLRRSGFQVFGLFDAPGSNQITGIDLDRQGRLVPGFPVFPPGVSFAFESLPVFEGGRMYVAARQNLPGSSRIATVVLCYELVHNDEARPLRLVWQQEIARAAGPGSGEVLPAGSATTSSIIAGLTADNGQLFCNSGRGVIGCLSLETGEPEWLVVYPRVNSRANGSGADSRQEYARLLRFRDGPAPQVQADTIFAMPADHLSVWSIHRSTGQVHWSVPLPAAYQMPDVSAETLLAGGHQLVWLDRNSGQIVTRFPGTFFNTLPGMRQPPVRGRGRPCVWQKTILFPGSDAMYKMAREPDRHAATGTRPEARVRVLAKRQEQEFAGGGNLVAGNGMIVVAGDDSIRGMPATCDSQPESPDNSQNDGIPR